MTAFTRAGAEAGAITRPSTSVAFSGGGGGGWKVAPPPPLGGEGSANAVAVATGASRQTAPMTTRTVLFELTKGGILFRTPTGLADGLALKELARSPGRRVRPSGFYATLVPPLRVTADSAWREATRCFSRVALLRPGSMSCPDRASRTSAQAIRTINPAVIPATVR